LTGIDIGLAPDVVMGPLALAWHSLFALAGMVVGVGVGLRLGRQSFTFEQGYAVALAGIGGGLIGARALHVAERWSDYLRAPLDALAVWNGGSAIVGGVAGGVLAAIVAMRLVGAPVGRTLDIGSIGLPIGMAIGRVGDLINGEHHALPCHGLAWCIRYTDPASLGQREFVHPAVAYEMAWDLVVVAIIVLVRLSGSRPRREGRLLLWFLVLYGLGRFAIGFFRLDPIVALGLQQAQLGLALVVVASALALAGLDRPRAVTARRWARLPAWDSPRPSRNRAGRGMLGTVRSPAVSRSDEASSSGERAGFLARRQ
jgi:phosphatidylglycerol:prolipoprotein diacylglycerol transferase